MLSATPVKFKNRAGNFLFGILERPDGHDEENVAVVFLSPGTKMRVGPHRLYNKLSEKIVQQGYAVLRFDFTGLGDSEGEIDEPVLANVYNSIHDGRYINDTQDALDWLEREHGYTRFLLCGLCGGAITGLLAGTDDERVEGLLSLGLINVFEGGENNFSRYITDGELELLVPGYIERLKDPASWKRLLTFKSDIRAILKILMLPVKKRLRTAMDNTKSEDLPAELQHPVPDPNSNVNPKFAPAFFKMLKGNKRLLLVYSAQDRLVHEFQEKFEKKYQRYLDQFRDLYEVKIIDNANHILSDPRWEAEMHDHALDWLQRHFAT